MTDRRNIENANMALDEIRLAYHADVLAGRSHSSELWAYGCRMLRAAGVATATCEMALRWALKGRRL